MKGVLFTYALTYGGAVVALFRPFVGLQIYICFSILRPDSLWAFALPRGNYSRVVMLATLIGWALYGFGDWRLGRAWPIMASLVAFFLWAVASACIAPLYPAASWVWVDGMTKILIPCLVGISLIDSVARLKRLAWVVVLSQGYVALEFNIYWLNGVNYVVENGGFGAMEEGSVAIGMVCAVGPALFLGLQSPRWWQKAVCLASAICLMHFSMFSMTRGGMLGLVVTAALGFVLIPKRPKDYLLFAVLILACLRLAGENVRTEFMTTFASEKERDASAQGRIILWRGCKECMAEHPLFGIGPDNFPLIADRFGFKPPKEAHNLWLTEGAEMGLPGLGFLLFYYGFCCLRLLPVARGRVVAADPWLRPLSSMVITSLAGFAISAMFISLDMLETPYYIAMIGAGVLKLTSRLDAHGVLAPPSWGGA